MNKKQLAILAGFCLFLSGCLNMPTEPAQITGAYVSPTKYANLTCPQLETELTALSRRESELVLAQQERYKTSQMQAFWYGYGQGDGLEASELANVRGDKEAVKEEMDKNTCK